MTHFIQNPRTTFSAATFGTILLGLSTLVPACTRPQSETCESGIVCPTGSTCAAKQDICIYNECGDGKTSTSEVCDDGNIENGDGCSADCKSSEGCGDGIKNEAAGELCDDGNTKDGDGCSANCRSLEKCGNKVIDFGEMCDDGNNESGDGCKDDCTSDERCGNGREDFHIGEVCDDGNRINNDGCSNTCISTENCGNGIVDRGEECDDDNENNNDGCIIDPDALCKIAYCGDGFVLETPTGPGTAQKEECDGDGRGEGGATRKCNADCTKVENIVSGSPAGCGDGVVNAVLGEECDDGDKNGLYLSCTSQCKLTGIEECGDGRKNGPEACDQGAMNGTGYGFCKSDCSGYDGECGDGKTHPEEHCDDGPQNGEYGFCNDLCDADGPFCGDNNHQLDHEACDDGPGGGYNKCKDDCSGLDQYCGDSKRQSPQETCDFGAQNANGIYNGCNTNCTLGPRCGDGGAPSHGEACDDGNTVTEYGTNSCASDCRSKGPFCGDGNLQKVLISGLTTPEICDDGSQNNDNNALHKCRKNCDGACSDGIKNGNEGCDLGGDPDGWDGNNGNGDPNSPHLCYDNCAGWCGDGKVTNGEDCDNGWNNNTGNESYQQDPTCRKDCTWRPHCGDEVESNGETCDQGKKCTNGTRCDYPQQCQGVGDGLCRHRESDACTADCKKKN